MIEIWQKNIDKKNPDEFAYYIVVNNSDSNSYTNMFCDDMAEYLNISYNDYIEILKEFGAFKNKKDNCYYFRTVEEASECYYFIQDNILQFYRTM